MRHPIGQAKLSCHCRPIGQCYPKNNCGMGNSVKEKNWAVKIVVQKLCNKNLLGSEFQAQEFNMQCKACKNLHRQNDTSGNRQVAKKSATQKIRTVIHFTVPNSAVWKILVQNPSALQELKARTNEQCEGDCSRKWLQHWIAKNGKTRHGNALPKRSEKFRAEK